MKKCILFIGADYTSIWAYKQLVSKSMLHKIKNGSLELIMICDKKHHSFNALYGEVITGIIPEESIYTPLRQIVKHAKIIQGKAIAVSPFLQKVTYLSLEDQEKEIVYDHLVMGCGIEESSKSVAGLDAYSVSIRKHFGLTELRCMIKSHLLDFYSNSVQRSHNIVVVGSGLIGIETASYLAEYIEKEHDKSLHKPHLYLINARGRNQKDGGLKQVFLAQYVEKTLRKKGVTYLNHALVKEVFEEGVLVSDGSFIPSRMTVQALNKNVMPIKGLRHLSLNPSKKIDTDFFLNAKGYDNIWCGGEVSLVTKPNTNEHCPSDPIWAIMQGARIGKNIKRMLEDKEPRAFNFSGFGQIAGLGTGKSALEIMEFPIGGWLAYLIRTCMLFYFFPAKVRLANFWWKNFIGKKNANQEIIALKRFNSENRNLVMTRQKRAVDKIKIDQD